MREGCDVVLLRNERRLRCSAIEEREKAVMQCYRGML